MSKITTLILRFRDFSEKSTIREHKKIINEKGYVYWGWWAKPQEKVPLNDIIDFRDSFKGSEKEIILFDSGTQKVYTAKCINIHINNGDPCTVEDKSYIPEYYRKTNCRMWFKLNDISDELPSSECKTLLHKYSYLYIKDFFVNEANSRVFKDKIVYGTQELFEQQLTIWFLRTAKSKDPRHEIHSYEHDYDRDEKNLNALRVLDTNTMLWLSDLHFSDNHGFSPTPGSTTTLGECLKRALQINPHSDPDMEQISYVIVSGDLTFKCAKEEFDEAKDFFKEINSHFGLTESLYTIVPGNHDIAFSEKPYERNQKVEVAYDNAKLNYRDFYHNYIGHTANEYLFSVRRVLTKDLIPIEIIGLNSCILQQTENHFQGMGYIGQDQLTAVKEYLDKTENSHAFRILVLHHHIIPAEYTGTPTMNPMYSTMIDTGRLLEFIQERHINVVLHGHVHREFYSELIQKNEQGIKHKVYIVGIGSTGIKSSGLSEGRNNMFGLLKFKKDELLVEGYQLNPNGEKGRELFKHSIPYKEN